MVFALIGVSMPNFWSGLLLVMLFSDAWLASFAGVWRPDLDQC